MRFSRALRTRRVAFLYDMVEGEFAAYRSYEGDIEAQAFVDAVSSGATGKQFIACVADCLVYTQALTFRWREDVPPEWLSLEDVWVSAQQQQPPDVLFSAIARLPTELFIGTWRMVNGRSKPVMLGWYDAVTQAQTPYVPREWRMETDDPN